MIDKASVTAAVEQAIAGTDLFIVDVQVNPGQSVLVDIDAPHTLDIDTLSEITRKIEENLPQDELGEYDLEVGSAGLTAPFKVPGQWQKNVGNEIELLTTDGRKLEAVLTAAAPETFTISYKAKEKAPGEKRPKLVEKTEELPYSAVKKANYLLRFK